MTGPAPTASLVGLTDLTDLAEHGSDAAVVAADAAARVAGVHVHQLSDLAEFAAVQRLYEQIWRPEGKNPPVTIELLRAMTKAGSYVGGAFDGADLVGGCIGFFSPPAQTALHSHIAGVAAHLRGRSVGFALKVHQRAWAMLHGVSEISWTFDPLVSRNAYFNLAKLGATAAEYLPNFYGRMDDHINGCDDTDRLLVTWRLDAPEVIAACAGQHRHASRPDGAVVGLDVSPQGAPVPGTVDGPTVLIAAPRDIEMLRTTDPDVAGEWRGAVRDTLGPLLADGARITGFDRTGWYVVDRKDAS